MVLKYRRKWKGAYTGINDYEIKECRKTLLCYQKLVRVGDNDWNIQGV